MNRAQVWFYIIPVYFVCPGWPTLPTQFGTTVLPARVFHSFEESEGMISLRSLVAMVTIFVAWSVTDFVIHQVILGDDYAATAHMWRPMAEMKMELIYSVVAFATFAFVYIYSRFFSDKSVSAGVMFGILFGLSTGFSMWYGTHAIQPLLHDIARTWFIDTTVQVAIAGLLVCAIVKLTADDTSASTA